MEYCSGEEWLRGRRSNFGVVNLGLRITCEARTEAGAGRESHPSQQPEPTPRMTEAAGIDDTVALCSELQAMRIIVEQGHDELVPRQRVAYPQHNHPRQRFILPSYRSVRGFNGITAYCDLFAADLQAYVAIPSNQGREQRLRRVLRRRQRAFRSKNAELDSVERGLTEEELEDIFGGNMWSDILAETPSPVRAEDYLGQDLSSALWGSPSPEHPFKRKIAQDAEPALAQKRRLDFLAEYQQMLLSCRCPRECICRMSVTLAPWQVKLRDVYIERIFDYEQRRDMRRALRSQQPGESRSTRWKDVYSRYASLFLGRRRAASLNTTTSPGSTVFGDGEPLRRA